VTLPSELDQQIRAILNGYDHDAAGQIDDLTGAIRAVLDLHKVNHHDGLCDVCAVSVQVHGLYGTQERCPTQAVIAARLGITERTTS
jgi:hypothetical protein